MAVNIQEAEQKIKKYKETLEAYIKASMSANDDSPNKIDEKEQKEIDRLKDMIVKIEARILELKKNDNNEALPVNLNNADDKEDALRKKIFKKIIIQRKEFHRWRGILVNQHNLQENKRAAEFNLKEGYDKVFKASEVLNQMINTIVTKFKDKK